MALKQQLGALQEQVGALGSELAEARARAGACTPRPSWAPLARHTTCPLPSEGMSTQVGVSLCAVVYMVTGGCESG
jgi:hypothetical protein